VRGFWVGVAEKVAAVLKPLLDKLGSLDLASCDDGAFSGARSSSSSAPSAKRAGSSLMRRSH